MLRGQKVNLRPPERRDLDQYRAWLSDPEVNRFLTVRGPLSVEDEEAWFERLQAPSDRRVFAIETAEGALIGNVGLHHIEDADRHAELGIFIGNAADWGQGYGGDAITTLLRWAFEELNLNCVYLIAREDNARAIRCYEKCGFQKEGRLRDRFFRQGKYRSVISMSILRSEFAASAQ